jgi:hypothetical protein
MDAPIEMDALARATCANLAREFDLQLSPLAHSENTGQVSIGIEVEVPWSSYFPQLWERFGLAHRGISDLTKDELDALSTECSRLEDVLKPRLAKTIECGLPRGNDRYWEFAFNPTHTTDLLVEQVRLLTAAGLLPRNRAHSLHVTVGGIPPCRSLYYLAMLLEVNHVTPQRLRDGIAASQSTIHTGWARKGRAGIYRKGADDLVGGASLAAEIRVLQLPQNDEDFAQIMDTVQWAANAIHQKRAGLNNPLTRDWAEIEAACSNALISHGLPDSNWGRGSEYGGEHKESWLRFADLMPSIQTSLRGVLDPFKGERSAAIDERPRA